MLSLIVAMAENRIIGKDNKLPWHYPEDLKYFKETTLHKTVVMGRLTYESILESLKKPLPNRKSIIITRSPEKFPGVECYTSVEDFLAKYGNSDEEIFIIGGARIYQALLPYCDRLYITKIHKSYEGDTYFPEFKEEDFKLISEKKSDELTFCVYERRV